MSSDKKLSKSKEDEVIKNALLPVIDPELGVSVIDLGLLYGIEYTDLGGVVLNMTLTSPACPLTESIESDAKKALEGIVKGDVEVNWVFNPPWSTDMITDDGRAQLAAIGFNF